VSVWKGRAGTAIIRTIEETFPIVLCSWYCWILYLKILIFIWLLSKKGFWRCMWEGWYIANPVEAWYYVNHGQHLIIYRNWEQRSLAPCPYGFHCFNEPSLYPSTIITRMALKNTTRFQTSNTDLQ
jgi:hypothetical protein